MCLRTTFLRSGALSPGERYTTPLYDAVGATVKMAQLLISGRRCLVYGLRGVCWKVVHASSDIT